MLNWILNATLADWRRLIRKLLPHIAIIISGMLVVFFVIDRINKPMEFMTNEFHKRLTFVLSILAIYMAVRIISLQRKTERAAQKRKTSASVAPSKPAASAAKAKPTAARARTSAKKNDFYY